MTLGQLEVFSINQIKDILCLQKNTILKEGIAVKVIADIVPMDTTLKQTS